MTLIQEILDELEKVMVMRWSPLIGAPALEALYEKVKETVKTDAKTLVQDVKKSTSPVFETVKSKEIVEDAKSEIDKLVDIKRKSTKGLSVTEASYTPSVSLNVETSKETKQ
jgi:hypothetical protein